MIKNNFIITEEEKSHILNLTRLPNFRNPVRLSEQDTGGLKVSWNSEKQKPLMDVENAKKLLKTAQSRGSFQEFDFGDENLVVKWKDYFLKMINANFRGKVISYFISALEAADKIYPNKDYLTYAKDLKTKSEEKTQELRVTYNSTTFNTLTDPDPDDRPLYEESVALQAPFGGVFLWKFKKIAGIDGSSVGDVTMRKRDIGQAQESVIRYIDTSFSGNETDLTDVLCIDALEFYQNKVVNKQYPLSSEKLRVLKRTIAYCNTSSSYAAGKKNIFGKIRNKTSGNVYNRLNKKAKENLNNLQSRNDEFKINLTDPDKN